MSVFTCLKSFLVAVLCASWAYSVEPVFQPWIPQHLDDWPALVAEAKAYVETTNATQKATGASIQFYVSAEDQPISIGEDSLVPPKDIFPGDHISLRIWTVKDRTSSQGCGGIVVWRSVKRGAFAVKIELCVRKESGSWTYPDQKSSVPFFDAQINKLKPPSGAWETRLQNFRGDTNEFWWNATWQRLDDRARTRDDAQGVTPALRIEDRRWLSESPTALGSKTQSPVEPVTYQARVNAHAGVQQALARFRSGFLARPLIVYEVKHDGLAQKLGIKPGDSPIAIGTSRVTSRSDYRFKRVGKAGGKETIRFARLGSDPFTVAATSEPEYREAAPDSLGFEYTDGAPDPGMAVLEVVAKADATLVTDAAVMMYAFDESDLTACALSRLTGHIPVPALAFMRAWNAAASDDIGSVDVLLRQNFSQEDGDLLTEIEDFKKANRTRSGRFIWAWPEKAGDPKFDGFLRHIVSPIPITERFTLFDGRLIGTYFSLSANDRVQSIDQASSLLSVAGGVLKTSNTYATSEASFGNIPERCQMTCNFTIVPTPARPSSKGDAVTPPFQFLSVGFETRSARMITSEGMGKIRIHANGGVSFHCSTVELSDSNTGWRFQPLPISVFVDGTSINKLRIIRIAQTQRIELNGHLISQGFLPLIDSTDDPNSPHLGIVLSVNDAECHIRDVLFQIPKEGMEANGF